MTSWGNIAFLSAGVNFTAVPADPVIPFVDPGSPPVPVVSTYTVTTNPGGNGTLTCTPTTVDSGSTSSCTAAGSTGYYVSAISGCGISYSNSTSSVTTHTISTTAINSNCTVSSSFAPRQYTVSANPTANGTITGGSSGTTVTRTKQNDRNKRLLVQSTSQNSLKSHQIALTITHTWCYCRNLEKTSSCPSIHLKRSVT